MTRNAFDKFRWGFLFIMLDFRIQGIDILPDFIGYIMLTGGLGLLAERSVRFAQARGPGTAMIFISLFSLYERPAQGGGIHFGVLGPLGFLIGIVSLVVGLLTAYHLFGGIGEMAGSMGRSDIAAEADLRWSQYLTLQIAGLAGIVLLIIPAIAVLYIIALLVATIALTAAIVGFMGRCADSLGEA